MHSKLSFEYALMATMVMSGMMAPEEAVKRVLKDMQASGVDLHDALRQMRTMFGKYDKILDAIDRLLPPENAGKKPVPIRAVDISIREIR